VTISPEKIILQRKVALRYIHPRTLYVGFTVRVGDSWGVRIGVRFR